MKTVMTRLFFALLLLFCLAGVSAQIDKCQPIPDLVSRVQSKLIDKGELDKALSTLREMLRDPDFQGCPNLKLIREKITYVEGLIRKRDANLKSYKTCPDGNHPHLIDLGLPSGTKWACCNVGATKPEGDGDYYAWGETTTKSDYSWSTYKHCDGSSSSCHDLGSSICGTQYDVAHVKWGGPWQLPTLDQIKELLDKCNKGVWTTQNGVEGRKFTGPNGGSIFLPAAGYRLGADLYSRGTGGYCWSGTQSASYSFLAYYLYFYSFLADWYYFDRCCGHSVRPVAR